MGSNVAEQALFVEGVRLLITLALTAGGFLAGESVASAWVDVGADAERGAVWGAVLGAGFGYVLGGVIGRRFKAVVGEAEELIPTRSAPEILVGGFGLLMGVIVGAIAAVPVIALLPPTVGWPLGGLVVFVSSSYGWRLFTSRSDELAAWAGLAEPTAATDSTLPDRYLLDSSAAIDGRVVEMFRSRLLRGRIEVAGFVVDELQALADAEDAGVRKRGRRGLDHLDVLRRIDGTVFTVLEDTVPETNEVDAKLITLALRDEAILVTTDHNLAAAAELRGATVVNPHSIGEKLRLPVANGDHLALTIEKTGSEPGQGVGYLDDGTMVVVTDAADDVGVTLDVEVANLVSTAVGRLVFAKRV